ncbi:MAG: hypothetical protein A2Z91_08215 [Deltaproteobacteria bacterium GWA2_38_16]|nr:MAG: hypothetical protein A2Z91_08215 [Deltaproteobacteria bacterium GWA2_38_16]OGQ01890.1 MAG: hypothetical protein A3D19_03225 [Deltaproteobacteria bacterium RIFCSPHIGHO2_02_FULL_38_15]OGQ29949.1 MAG: hypothetical protein A3A72_05895 [Deltaproteobacteria bacterium RIFCSPLOWO2_01_FULL_38_9]OGQ60028.1 MAG: hypothetical protein A3G92_04420 [Deltaproteobacteria bacterium RIFCSPLOWO2_12_FULL_38_8]HBQ20753.1 acyl-CoA thioesterase [Deltaproteobacteria bacterium]
MLHHKHTLTIRFFDVDAMGHTNNAVYFTYFEEARMSYFMALGFTQKKFLEECPFILANASCDYKSPSYMGDILDIYTGVTQLKNASFVMEYEMKTRKDQRLVAQAKTILVTFDYKAQKVIPIPKELKQQIQDYEDKLKC